MKIKFTENTKQRTRNFLKAHNITLHDIHKIDLACLCNYPGCGSKVLECLLWSAFDIDAPHPQHGLAMRKKYNVIAIRDEIYRGNEDIQMDDLAKELPTDMEFWK